jgi:predicted aldo/keto reductase-like oxidoreductase
METVTLKSAPLHPARRQRTCRACGKKFDYPVKGIAATRHHCEDCVPVPPETRKVLERLNERVTRLERQLESQARRQQANAGATGA